MSKKKMKPSSKNVRPHYVDEDTETVYVSVDSWMGSMSAPHWAKRYFPGYKCAIISPEDLKKKFNTEEDA